MCDPATPGPSTRVKAIFRADRSCGADPGAPPDVAIVAIVAKRETVIVAGELIASRDAIETTCFGGSVRPCYKGIAGPFLHDLGEGR